MKTLEALVQLHAHLSNTARTLIKSYKRGDRNHKYARDMALGAEVVVRLFLMAAQKQLPPK